MDVSVNPDQQQHYGVVIHGCRVLQADSPPLIVFDSSVDVRRHPLLSPEQHPGHCLLQDMRDCRQITTSL